MRIGFLLGTFTYSVLLVACGPSEECKAKAEEARAAWREAADFARGVSDGLDNRDSGTKATWLMIASACGTAGMACKAEAEVSAGGPIQSIGQMLRTLPPYKKDEFKPLFDKADDLYDEKRKLCNP